MAIALVRQNGYHAGAAAATTTDVLTLSANATAGNMITAIFAGKCTGAQTLTFSDSVGNTWATDTSFVNGNIVAIGSTMQDVGTLTTSNSVTATCTGNFANERSFWLEEFSGVATGTRLDQQVSSSNAGGTGTNTGNLTPSVADVLAVALNYHDPFASTDTLNTSGTVGTYSSFTQTNSSTVAANRTAWPVYQIVSGGSGTAQKHAWTWTSTSSQFVGTAFALYKPFVAVTTPTVGVAVNYAAIHRASRW